MSIYSNRRASIRQQIAIECELSKKSKRRIEKIIGHYLKKFAYSEVCLTQALRHAPTRLITPFSYLAVVFTAIADWAFWQQSLSSLAIIGTLLVIGGAILTVLMGKGRMQVKLSA